MSLHFGENNAFHFTHFRGSVADSLYKYHFRASLSLYYRSPLPSGLSAAIKSVQTRTES